MNFIHGLAPASDSAICARGGLSKGQSSAGDAPLSSAGQIHDLGNLIQLAASALDIMARRPALESSLMSLIASARISLDRAGKLVRQSVGAPRAAPSAAATSRITDCFSEIRAAMPGDRRTGLHLDMRCEPGLPDIGCDPLELLCAVLNLVFNAREAMGGRGVIRLRARRSGSETRPVAEIRVIDKGIGMSPETVARAFDPFFTTRSDGTGGFGLPMVQRFAEECGGEILVESRLGTGTNVILRLPLAAAATPHAYPIHVQSAAPLHRETQP